MKFSICLIFFSTFLSYSAQATSEQNRAPFYDSPSSFLTTSADHAWLLEKSASIPFGMWPRQRSSWTSLPVTPQSEALKSALPKFHHSAKNETTQGQASEEPAGIQFLQGSFLSLDLPEISLHADFVLQTASENFTVNSQDYGLTENGNGYDLEAVVGENMAIWSHLRDTGVGGDLEIINETIFTEKHSWLWHEQQLEGDLTHDESRGGIAFRKSLKRGGTVHFAFLRAPFQLGTAGMRPALGGIHSVPMTQIFLDAKFGALHFRQTLGELDSQVLDSLASITEADGRMKLAYREKWISSHRLEWATDRLAIGLAEIVIIGDRGPAMGYLLPTNMLWSEQHAQRDRDNALMMLDLRVRLPKILQGAWSFGGHLLIDDYSLSDFGEELEGQKTASSWAFTGFPFPYDGESMHLGKIELPGLLGLRVGQSRTRPYVGTHFFASSRLTHGSTSLGQHEQPNSRSTDWTLFHSWRPAKPMRISKFSCQPLLQTTLSGTHLAHGANPIDLNVGGNQFLPHRDWLDDQDAPFLAGDLEIEDWRTLGIQILFPIYHQTRGSLGNLIFDLSYRDLHEYGSQENKHSQSQLFRMSWERHF